MMSHSGWIYCKESEIPCCFCGSRISFNKYFLEIDWVENQDNKPIICGDCALKIAQS